MADKVETQEVLFGAIKSVVAEVEGNGAWLTGDKARMLEILARAYRYAAGGAQPGGAAPEK